MKKYLFPTALLIASVIFLVLFVVSGKSGTNDDYLISPWKDKVSVTINQSDKYFTIVNKSDKNLLRQGGVNISGWSVRTEKRTLLPIPQGTFLFRQGIVNPLQDIVLEPGEKAIIVSDQSPIGVSFKINKCSPKLERYQVFSPKISVDSEIEGENIFYNDCVEKYSNDFDFFKLEWRVYLDSESEEGRILLLDDEKRLVASLIKHSKKSNAAGD